MSYHTFYSDLKGNSSNDRLLAEIHSDDTKTWMILVLKKDNEDNVNVSKCLEILDFMYLKWMAENLN